LQVDIRDIQVFHNTLTALNEFESRIESKINVISNQLQKNKSEVETELNISINLLNVAKANESQKQAFLIKKTAELASAIAREASALASGNPIAIAAASAYVAQKSHEEMIAQREYQTARENRINMERRVELVKKAKYQIDTLFEETKMRLSSSLSQIVSLSQVLKVRLTKGDLSQKDYLSQQSRIGSETSNYKNIPQSNGSWSGEVGNSTWKPDRDTIPKQPYGNEKTWGEILDEYNIDGIEFKNGEPDFTPISEGTVTIDDFSIQRDENFYQADENLAKVWNKENRDDKNWTPSDIKQYRKENKLTWHERSDMKSMDLVSQEVHGNIPHSGGISKAKKKLELEEENE